MSSISKRKKESSKPKIKSMGDHKEFLKRISKTLYYGQLPTLPCLSLPVTEISCEVWSMAQRGQSVRRLHADQAAHIARSACVSPCALVLAILYLERLKRCNPDYLAATPPADLFLVSLMVSNKFLQDDGEDDEVICSEWAASGGLHMHQLNKLEVDFLNAIEWNLYTNEQSFESGLCWLERQVAIKQGQLRGFFTYSDLAVTYDKNLLRDLIHSVSKAWFTLALTYLTSLVTLVTSTLVISNMWLPNLEYTTAKGNIATNISSHLATNEMHLHLEFTNISLDHITDIILEQTVNQQTLKCCEDWHKYQEMASTKKNWYQDVALYDFKSFQSWWSKTSVMNWLYQTSLINPMQRWLEKVNKYTIFIKDKKPPREQCGTTISEKENCLQQKLNLSKLIFFATSISDR